LIVFCQVSVLYLWAPPRIAGGELVLRRPTRPPWRSRFGSGGGADALRARPTAAAVDAAVEPRANRCVVVCVFPLEDRARSRDSGLCRSGAGGSSLLRVRRRDSLAPDVLSRRA
jgi:hypothetical protein